MKSEQNKSRIVLNVSEQDKQVLTELAQKEKLSVSSFIRNKFIKNVVR